MYFGALGLCSEAPKIFILCPYILINPEQAFAIVILILMIFFQAIGKSLDRESRPGALDATYRYFFKFVVGRKFANNSMAFDPF